MLRQVAQKHSCRVLSRCQSSKAAREYTYYDNFEVKDGVALLRLNGPGKMNIIHEPLLLETQKIFKEKIEPNKEVKAVVFISSKPDNFIAGADIESIVKIGPNKEELARVSARGQQLLSDMKKAKLPLVAAINGPALGGGLEWAMFCDYRIATTSKKTALGLPEVKLGFLPGFGGTYNLPKLIGVAEAMDMILTGKNLKAEKAKKMGLVDLVVDAASLEEVALMQAKGLAAGKVKAHQRKKNWTQWALEDTSVGRDIMFKKAKEQVDKNSGGFYPAPYEILNVLKENYGKSQDEHLKDESQRFGKLASTPVSEALVGLFFSTNAVKKHDLPKPKQPVKTIAVLGAGLMGSGIAQVSIDQGKYNVLLKDKEAGASIRGDKIVHDVYKKKLSKKRMTNHDYCLVTSRLTSLHDGSSSWKNHFAKADMVIEAVFEDLNIKHKVLAEIEAVTPDHCIFATNTSAIPIGEIAAGAKRPDRVVGMHYFSPVPSMPLLEIISHKGTAPEVAAAAMDVGVRQGKTPIFVKDVPGFFVNRCLTPYFLEMTSLLAQGVDPETVDKAMKSFGFPVGPCNLVDEIGVDVTNHASEFMLKKGDLGDRLIGKPAVLANLVKSGASGRKTEKGFYNYPKDAKKGDKRTLSAEFTKVISEFTGGKKTDVSQEEIQGRLLSRFINETAFCLQDGIIRAPADGDIGAVFGIGFSPFLGGPFRYLDHKGTRSFVDQMYRYRDQFGPQFEPAQILKDYAASDKKFHGN